LPSEFAHFSGEKNETGTLNRGAKDNGTRGKKLHGKFNREAVRLMETSGKPVAQFARDLGTNDNNLYR
jgi:transposase-like protein